MSDVGGQCWTEWSREGCFEEGMFELRPEGQEERTVDRNVGKGSQAGGQEVQGPRGRIQSVCRRNSGEAVQLQQN